MKSIIICEGKTDLILISYYLCQAAAWHHLNGREKKNHEDRLLNFKVDNKSTQDFDWYTNSKSDLLCIYAVGSIDRIGDGLGQVVGINLFSNSEPFDKVIIICDRDDDNVEKSIFEEMHSAIGSNMNITSDFANNTWTSLTYNLFGNTLTTEILPLIIPLDEVGTLETFLLNCRKSIDGCESELVDKCGEFVGELQKADMIRGRYMYRRGIRPKILLGTYFSVVSPNRTFDAGNKILTSVNWEEYAQFNKTFKCLLDL